MKIRFDFVTNSSSSSFICFKITNEELSLACRRHGIPLKYYGKTMENFSWSYGDGYMDIETPNGGSITDWFISVLEKMDFSYEKYCRKDELIEYLKTNKDKIDDATTSSIIDHHSIVSDGDGSSYHGEVRKGGKIYQYYLDEEDWDSEKMGTPLWEELEGECDRIREEAKRIGNFNESEDPRVNKDVNVGIFTSSIDTVNQQLVCLTGDFDHGSKDKVEKYVISKGGVIASSVTNKTNILLVGNKGSEAWTFGNYGRKIEKAISLKEKTGIVIIKETDFFNCDLDKETVVTESNDVDSRDFVVKDLPNNTAFIAEYTGGKTDIVIPNKIGDKVITKIGDKVFKNNKDIVSVFIQDGVTAIGDHVFNGCKSLERVDVPNSINKIGKSAFKDCKSLNAINIPEGIAEIEEYTFAGCKSLKNIIIPSSVECIYGAAFKECTGLTDLVIPSGVKKLGHTGINNGGVFHGCKNLINVAIEGNIYELNKTFYECTSLETIILPNTIKKMSDFRGCKSLKSINIPSSVTTILGGFDNCTSLTSIEVPNSVTDICSGFDDCTALTKIEIPNSVVKLHHCFRGCVGLTDIEIPSSVTSIFGAFSNCVNLTSINIPDSVTNLDGFRGCTGLTSIEIPNSVTDLGGFDGCTGLTSIEIPNSVTVLSAFSDCTNLTSINIPDSVTELGGFRGRTGLTNIKIPTSVLELNWYSFKETNIKTIEVPDSVRIINNGSFSDSDVTLLVKENSCAHKYAQENGIKFELI